MTYGLATTERQWFVAAVDDGSPQDGSRSRRVMSTTNPGDATGGPMAPPRLAAPPTTSALEPTDTGRGVDWVSGDVIGFRGFGSSDEAARAAWVAHRALARRLDRGAAGGRPIPIEPESLALARSGDREAILADGRPIATLLRPGADSPSGPDSFGFEIQVDPRTDELTMRAAVHLTCRTLRRSCIRWPVWVREPGSESSPPSEERPPTRGG